MAALLRELVKIDGVKWIRLFYLYPTYFDDELLDVILSEDKICKYVDIPLQHISDSVLSRMHRRDSSESIRTLLRKLRAASPRMTIRTTLMVGFLGKGRRISKNSAISSKKSALTIWAPLNSLPRTALPLPV